MPSVPSRTSHGNYATAFAEILQNCAAMNANVETALESVETAMLDMASISEENAEAEKELDTLMDAFCSLLDAKRTFTLRERIIEKMKANLINGKEVDGTERMDHDGGDDEDEELDDMDKLLKRFSDPKDLFRNLNGFEDYFNTQLTAVTAAYAKKSSEEKYSKVTEYIELRKKLAEICTTGPYANNSQQDDSDEDLAIVGGQSNYKCPITQAIMTSEIYTSKICSHSFSSAIQQMIKSGGQRIECPVAGCNKYIRSSDVARDKGMERKAKIHFRRMEEAREEESSQRAGVTQVIE
ncbi:UNVERIFIED_CONTAM: hypothetical protein HDU68_002139 [Siphonaria sp. JEL0065]|nr:hypothetical protein HDU68_002139 [Siphonaria sp. JEL0065]